MSEHTSAEQRQSTAAADSTADSTSPNVVASTPRVDGLFAPIRTAPHARTFVSWPSNFNSWGPDTLAAAQAEYSAIVAAIAQWEPVTVLADPGAAPALPRGSRHPVEVFETPLDNCWVRDNGPFFVVDGDGGAAVVRGRFNAWGGRSTFGHDALVPVRLAERLGMRCYDAPVVLEGGGISFDGEGTAITTESVHLNPNRNPGVSREMVEQALRECLGVEKVIWLRDGLVEDRHTDGHSDNVVQFVRPGVVLAQMAPDRSNPNWEILSENRARLSGETDAAGRPLEIVELGVLPYVEDERGSYAVPYTNYYPVNGAIVALELGRPEDETGFAALRALFPEREIVGAPSRLLAIGGGGIGCITQHQPTGRPLAPNAEAAAGAELAAGAV
jgi:agmatine deiminase